MQFFGTEDIKDLTKTSQTTLEWAAGSVLRIGGQAYTVSSALTLDTATDIDTGAIANDTIYYVYAVVVTGVVSLKYSLSSSAPTGYSAYRLIGSFGTDSISEISGTSNKDQGKVGDVIHSMLTEEQFISENGAGWVLADGRDVTGSKYDTLILGGLGGNIPDMRGQFLRGKDYGRHLIDGKGNPDGDLDVGFYQQDGIASHTHGIPTPVNQGQSYALSSISGNNQLGNTNHTGGQDNLLNTYNNNGASSETRVKNTTVNIFIKIEDIQV